MSRLSLSLLIFWIFSSIGLCNASAEAAYVMVTIGMQRLFEDVRPAFESLSGQKVITHYYSSPEIVRRIQNGEHADFVIANRAAIDNLVRIGVVPLSAKYEVAISSIVVAVPAGSPKPDISTTEKLKGVLLAAKSISYTDPSSGGPSGVHFAKVLDRLGIAEEVRAKTKFPPAHTFVGDVLASGGAEIGIQQAPELSGFQGVEIVAAIPDELQDRLEYDAAVPATAARKELAAAFIAFIRSPPGEAALRLKGLEPRP